MRYPGKIFHSIWLAIGLIGKTPALAEVITQLPASQSQIIKITDKGIQPRNLSMQLQDSIVFILNDSYQSLATVEVDYHGKTTHCASANLSVEKDKKLRSKHPFGRYDFASMCFRERGVYPFVVYGVKQQPTGITGSIIMVERDPSHYYGQFIPLQSDSFSQVRITVAITDPVGRRVEQVVGPLTVSTKPRT
jgi:hypothetical protein